MSVYQWLTMHPAVMSALSVGIYHVGSAFVGSLPMPTDKSTDLYRFVFAFSNRLAANYARASAANTPAGDQPAKG